MPVLGVEDPVIRAVFFDIYGTLIDIRTDEGDPWVYEVLAQYLAYRRVTISPDELKREFFDRVRDQLRQSAEEHPEVDVYNVFDGILRNYGSARYPKAVVEDTAMLFRSLTRRTFRLFPDLFDTLDVLRSSYRTAVISDAQWVFTEPETSILGIDRRFPFMLLSSRLGYKKPDTRLFVAAMDRLGVKAYESVYIGDNPHRDLVGAKMSGMRFILFRGDCRDYNGFRPDACFGEYRELPAVLEKLDEKAPR